MTQTDELEALKREINAKLQAAKGDTVADAVLAQPPDRLQEAVGLAAQTMHQSFAGGENVILQKMLPVDVAGMVNRAMQVTLQRKRTSGDTAKIIQL